MLIAGLLSLHLFNVIYSCISVATTLWDLLENRIRDRS